MRYGLIGSIILHIMIFGFVIFKFTRGDSKVAPPPQAVPVSVQIMEPKDFSERQAGKFDGMAEKPAPAAELKAAEAAASAKKEVPQKPSVKPAEKEAILPPPPAPQPPAPAPKPVEVAKAEPPAPAPKPIEVAKPEPPAPAPKPIEVAKAEPAMEKAAEKPVPKPAPKPVAKRPVPPKKPKPKPELKKPDEPKPDYKFDLSRIEADIHKDEARPARPQPALDTPQTKVYSDRQAALLNRDPNAGAPSGDYDPSRPWHPASSLQEQAMGVTGATGSMNAGTCADAIRAGIESNWDLPAGALAAEGTVVRLHVELRRDGMLLRDPEVKNPSSAPEFRVMAEAAVRAAMRAQPFNIPPQQYEQCRDMILRFNPRDMYGG